MKQSAFLLAIILSAFVFNGCSSKGGAKDEGAEAAGTEAGEGGPEIGKYGDGQGGAYGSGGKGGAGGYGSGSEGVNGLTGDPALDDPAKRVIYFMYDSSEVMPEYVSVINAHANFLASNPGRTITLEGHADERGSSEYNIALGEQRARSVAKMMRLQGASDSQMQLVSFGEEKPAVQGSDESAYHQNRRVEISYSGR